MRTAKHRFRSSPSAVGLPTGTRWHARGGRTGDPAAQPIGGDRSAVHDPAAVDGRVGARGVACCHVKGLHHAAVDQNPGWLGSVPSADDTSTPSPVVSEPQDHRPAGDQFEGLSLERLARLPGQAFETQRC